VVKEGMVDNTSRETQPCHGVDKGKPNHGGANPSSCTKIKKNINYDRTIK